MRFSLLPRAMQFFDMFDEVGAILTRASAKFVALVTEWDRVPERSDDLRHEEHACDEAVGRIIKALDRSFITPFDREDIHTLVGRLDDILDNMEETAHRFAVFRIDRPTPETVVMARIVQDCCAHLAGALQSLRSLKNADVIQTHLQAITRLENEADKVYRDTVVVAWPMPSPASSSSGPAGGRTRPGGARASSSSATACPPLCARSSA